MPRDFQRRSLNRREPQRETGRKVIIVCEGVETERGYFVAMRQTLRLTSVRVPVYHSGATDPLSIVRFAVARRQEQEDERTWTKDDSVWAVYDGVEHYQRDRDNWNRALREAQADNVRLAITNPSFELWYLLHYEKPTGMPSRHDARRMLKDKHLPRYDKADILYPDPLAPLTMNALTRADEITAHAKRNGLEPQDALCVEGVAELVRLLLSMGPKAA